MCMHVSQYSHLVARKRRSRHSAEYSRRHDGHSPSKSRSRSRSQNRDRRKPVKKKKKKKESEKREDSYDYAKRRRKLSESSSSDKGNENFIIFSSILLQSSVSFFMNNSSLDVINNK